MLTGFKAAETNGGAGSWCSGSSGTSSPTAISHRDRPDLRWQSQRQRCSKLFFYSPQKPLEASAVPIPPSLLPSPVCGLRRAGNCRSRVSGSTGAACCQRTAPALPRLSGLQQHPSTKGFRVQFPAGGAVGSPSMFLSYASLSSPPFLRKINYKTPSGEGLKEKDGVPGKTRQNHAVTEPTLFQCVEGCA